ncbi:MAG: Spy/CpxP family protein refolding chaperone [Burkholderiaceae bacterium]
MLKSIPRKTLLSLSLAAAVLGLSATAIAQGNATPEDAPAASARAPGTPGAQRMDRMMRHQGDRHERMQAMRSGRLEQLKADLKLTPEQEPAWLAFVARTAPPAITAPSTRSAGGADLNTLDRLEQMQARHDARSEAMKTRIDAVRSFYGSLSDAQKQVFDQQAMGGSGMHGGPHMGKHAAQGGPGRHMHGEGHGHGDRSPGRMAPGGMGPDGAGCPANG